MSLQDVATKFKTGDYVVTRRAMPTFVKGLAVPGDSYEFLMAASIQPVTGRELQDLAYGQQGTEMLVAYTQSELRGVEPSKLPPLAVVGEGDTEIFTATGHNKATGDGPYELKGTMPTGLSALTFYWVIVLDANTFQLATSYANAIAEIPVTMSTDGSGLTLVVTGNMTDTVLYKLEEWEVWKCEHWEAFGGHHWRAYISRSPKP